MEALAYAHSYASYERESGIEIDLPKMLWNWKVLPHSTWSNLLAVATFAAILSSTEVAFSNPETNAPDDDMLRGLTDPDSEEETTPNRPPAMPQPSPQETEAVPDRAPAPQPQNNSVTPPSNRSTPPSDDMLRGLTAPNEEENELDASPTAPQDAEDPAPQRTNSTPEISPSQPSPETTPSQPTASPSPPTVEPDFFYQGANLGMEAAQLTQTAKTQGEWEAVAQKWQQAIAAMRSVPSDNRDYTLAQQKIRDYQSNLDYAREQAEPPPRPVPSPSPQATQPQPSPSPSPEVAKPQPTASPSPQTPESPRTVEPDYFYQGVNFALEAAQQTQTAETPDEWNAVVQKWQQAIAAMRSVPSDSRDYNLAQQKVQEYQSNLSYAREQASRPPQPTASPSPQVPDSPQTVEPDFFYDGINLGMEAAQLTQTAKTPDEWNAVAQTWQQAIAAMRSVPSDSRDYNLAQQKVQEYQSNLSYAREQASRPPQPTASPSSQVPDSPQTVEPDFFYDGINLGMEAAQLTQTAKTPDEWNAVAQTWQQAIAAMRSVPSDSRDYNLAQQKIRDYQSNLSYAREQAEPPPRPVPSPSPQATPPQPTASPSPQAPDSPRTVEPDFFYDGINLGMEAAQLTQTAKTPDEWNAVVRKWQQAIAAMQAVPSDNRDYTLAQQKVQEYQSNLGYAREQASRPPQPTASPSPETQESPQTVEPDFFYDGINLGMEAAQLTQTAKTPDEWNAVVRKWQQAIAAMKAVPSDSRDYNLAQQKIQDYQSNLDYAQKMPNFFGQGVMYAMQAVELGQTAKTQGQWQQAAQTWQQAIAAMESVSPDRPQFAIAQQKVVEYDYYLDTLQGKIQSAIGRMVLKHAIRGSKISPKSVVYSGRGRFFVQNMMYSHTITVYNQQYELLKTISDTVNLSEYGHDEFPGTYRGAPVEATFSHGGQYAWVSNYQMYGSGFGNPGSDRCSPQAQHDPSFLYRINTDTLNIEQVIKVGSVPKYVAATPDNRFVLASNWCSWDLSVVDVEQNKEIRRIPLGAYPRGIAVDSNSGKAYVAVMGSSNIAIVNLRDFSVRWMKNVGAGPRHLNLSPDNRYLYASLNSEGTVAKIDLRAIDLTQNSNVSGKVAKVRTGSAPRSTVLSADGQFLYVVNYFSNTVSKVRTSDLKVLQSLPTDAHPIGITYDPETRRVWVVCYSGSILIFQD